MNAFALFLLIIFGRFFAQLITTLRPTDFDQGGLWGFFQIVNILLALVLMMILHEATHAVFFWVITRERPTIGLTSFYAYAAAPDWFIPKLPYTLIGLAPLILLTASGIAIIPIVSPEQLPYLFLVLTMNVAGAAGDIYVVAKVSRYPKDVLVKDIGDVFKIYSKA